VSRPWGFRAQEQTLVVFVYFAFSSGCIMPNVLPSESLAYASQPTPGTASFGTTIVPPAD